MLTFSSIVSNGDTSSFDDRDDVESEVVHKLALTDVAKQGIF